jgi:hypothetical protein
VRLRPLILPTAIVALLALPAAAGATPAPTTTVVTTVTTETVTTPAATPRVVPPATTTTGTTTTTPVKPPVVPQGKITFHGFRINGDFRAVLAGTKWIARGTTSIYVPGQDVVIRVWHGKKRVTSKQVRIHKQGKHGVFSASFVAKGVGKLRIEAVHSKTDQQRTLKARPFHVTVLKRSAHAGERSLSVRFLQNMLAAKGYVVGQRNVYDARTGRAVLAFRKMTGMARNTSASSDVFVKLQRGGGGFAVRCKGHGRHVEGDLTHQVLALIGAGGKVERLYPMSSGKPSTPTVLGSFRVYNRTPGTNSEGMVNSSYFIRGYAIHGYYEVPTYAASHGCLRVPIPDSLSIYNWVRYGTPVDVYYR